MPSCPSPSRSAPTAAREPRTRSHCGSTVPATPVGIDTRQVIHTDPKPNTTELEPNYLASCAFDNPFLPWLFSQEQSHDHIKPWLALVVVERDASQVVSDPRRPLPTLTLAAADAAHQLHDLTDSWAWAHAQVTGTSATLKTALVGPPELTLSRLVCPRRLRATTSYRARGKSLGGQPGRTLTVAAMPKWSDERRAGSDEAGLSNANHGTSSAALPRGSILLKAANGGTPTREPPPLAS